MKYVKSSIRFFHFLKFGELTLYPRQAQCCVDTDTFGAVATLSFPLPRV